MDITDLIDKVLAGQATKEEEREVERWKSLSEENKAEFEELQWLYDAVVAWDERAHDEVAEAGFHKLMGKVKNLKRKREIKRVGWMAGVALVVLVVVIVLKSSLYRASSEQGCLQFAGVGLGEVFKVVEDRYGVTVHFPREVSGCIHTGTYCRVSAEGVLESIGLSMRLRVETIGERQFRVTGDCEE